LDTKGLAVGRRVPAGTVRTSGQSGRTGLWRQIVQHRSGYLFVCPFFILYAIFGLYPAIYSMVLSFHDWGGGKSAWSYIGFANYARLWFADPVFRETLGSMAKYLLAIVPLMTVLALVLAVMLNSRHARFQGFLRTTLVLPYVLAPTVIAVVFYQLLDPSYGWLNLLLHLFGFGEIPWLGSEKFSLWAITIVMLWQFVGYNTLIMLAGLTGIPSELFDAAKVDGCNAFQEFRHVTVPLMRQILLFAAVMSTIGVLNMFAQPWLLTHGGPGYSSNTLSIMLYRTAFEFGRFGYASAVGITIFALSAVFSFLQIRLIRS
jgi:lactose/L-arabinose transport system permease protein